MTTDSFYIYQIIKIIRYTKYIATANSNEDEEENDIPRQRKSVIDAGELKQVGIFN